MRIQSITIAKTICSMRKIKALYKLMKNAVYGKTMDSLTNRIGVKLVINKKRLFKIGIKTKLHVTKNIW